MNGGYNHYVLCVLSPINYDNARDKVYHLHNDDVGTPFPGYQTNEAPVECLIELAMREDNPITGIICLTSNASMGLVSRRMGEEWIPVKNEQGHTFSAKEHFEQRVREFYEARAEGTEAASIAISEDLFINIPYDGNNPAANLKEIVDLLAKGDSLVDIETTGGPRDAAFLFATIVQFLEAKHGMDGSCTPGSLPVGLGKTVYANLAAGMIYRQNATFELNKLINAVSAFTEYGKADRLLAFFSTTGGMDKGREVVELCAALRRFSDDLSLCRTAGINENLNNIHRALNEFHTVTEEKMGRYEALSREMEELSDGDEATATELMAKRDEICVPRGQILFMTLVESLRKGMPKPVGANATKEEVAHQTLNIIRWCVGRGMLQQALALFKERTPECLEQLGFIGWGDVPPFGKPGVDGRNDAMVDRISQLATLKKPGFYFNGRPEQYPDVVMRKQVGSQAKKLVNSLRGKERGNATWSEMRKVLCAAKPSLFANAKCLEIKDERRLRAALMWYRVITAVRNGVMHVLEEGDTSIGEYPKNCGVVFRYTPVMRFSYIDCLGAESLKEDLLRAVDAMEGKVSLGLRWQASAILEPAHPFRLKVSSLNAVGDAGAMLDGLRQSDFDIVLLEEGLDWSALKECIDEDEAQSFMLRQTIEVTSDDESKASVSVPLGDRSLTALCELRRAIVLKWGVGGYVFPDDLNMFIQKSLDSDTIFAAFKEVRLKGRAGRAPGRMEKLATVFPTSFCVRQCVVPYKW